MRISDWSSDVCSSDLSTIFDVAARCGAPALGGRLLRAVRAGIWAGMALNARKAREDVRQWTTQGFSMTRSAAFMPKPATGRSEERRVGKEGVVTCRYRCCPYH